MITTEELSIATPQDADDFMIETGSDERVASMTFSPTRFPYTYAADYIRDCRRNTGGLSRGEASMMRKSWAEGAGISDESLAIILALRYMERYGITTKA